MPTLTDDEEVDDGLHDEWNPDDDAGADAHVVNVDARLRAWAAAVAQEWADAHADDELEASLDPSWRDDPDTTLRVDELLAEEAAADDRPSIIAQAARLMTVTTSSTVQREAPAGDDTMTPKSLYDATPSTTTPPTLAERHEAVARVHGQEEADRLFARERLAGRLYPATPAPPASPSTSVADRMYPIEGLIRGDLDRNLAKLAPRFRLTDEQRAAEQRDYNAMVRRTTLRDEPALAVAIHDAWTTERLRAARPGGEDAADVQAREVDAAGEETWAEMRQRFGGDFDALLARTKRYVASDPLLLEIMSTGDIGSRLDLVQALMEHVRRRGLGLGR